MKKRRKMMAKYLVINREAINRGDILTKDDIRVCQMSDEEVEWFLESQVSGDTELVIEARGIPALIKKAV